MTKKLRIVLAQLNLMVGDITGNLEKHKRAAIKARDELSADVIVFPELSLMGYPPEDLLFRKAFLNDADDAFQNFIAEISGIHCIVGHALSTSQGLFNACSFIYNGKILGQYSKQYLPNYGVFDEDRYFQSGHTPCVVPIHDIPVGLVICEDLWVPGPTHEAASHGARLILSPNASPFEIDKHERRVAVLTARARHDHVPIIYVNNVGGQDELVFDGGSMVVDENGNLVECAGFFQEKLLPVEVNISSSHTKTSSSPIIIPGKEERIYQALVLAVRDYIEKNHFPGVLVGASGGIDSALTLAIAVDALGKERVRAILMPSRFTADMSNEDATTLIQVLGIPSDVLSIEPSYKAFLSSLAPCFSDKKTDVTEENIQARCRAILLMALSNKFCYLVLTTSNRSELAVGYSTLYGDMAGGFAPLKDVPKTLVHELARYRNQLSPVIPLRTIERPPTAELAPDQRDEDSLPPYPILDKILDCYLNQSQSMTEIIAQGFDPETVIRIIGLIHKNQYKRRQAAVGPRINHKSFGRDWRYPITNGFKG